MKSGGGWPPWFRPLALPQFALPQFPRYSRGVVVAATRTCRRKRVVVRGVVFLMEGIERLEQLSLVSKVCTELENHLGINDKVLGKS